MACTHVKKAKEQLFLGLTYSPAVHCSCWWVSTPWRSLCLACINYRTAFSVCYKEYEGVHNLESCKVLYTMVIQSGSHILIEFKVSVLSFTVIHLSYSTSSWPSWELESSGSFKYPICNSNLGPSMQCCCWRCQQLPHSLQATRKTALHWGLCEWVYN